MTEGVTKADNQIPTSGSDRFGILRDEGIPRSAILISNFDPSEQAWDFTRTGITLRYTEPPQDDE